MKKTFVFILITSVFYLSAHAQNCNPEDLSVEGFEHFSKAKMYLENLEHGGNLLAIGELKAVTQTDSLWCNEVFMVIAELYEDLAKDNKGSKKLECLNNAIQYYKKYRLLSPDNMEILGKIKALEASVELSKKTIDNKTNIEMVYVEGMLNSDSSDCIHSFYIGKYEVTQEQWEAVMGTNPSRPRGPNLPVENVSHSDVELFLKELNRMTGGDYRLPTPTEWIYAANGGKNKDNYTYSGGYATVKVGWTEINSSNYTHPVGELEPNSLGIYDMSGNVSELCQYFNSYTVQGGCFDKSPIDIDEREADNSPSHNIGIRLVLPIDYYSVEETQWDYIIFSSKDFKQRFLEKNRREEEKFREKMEQDKKRRQYRNSFFPIIRMDKVWTDVNIGYDFEGEGMYMSATLAPGPIYVSALMADNDTNYFSAGLKFRIINRFDLLLGVSYAPQENLWGGDMELHYFIGRNVDLSGGVLFFPENRIIPHANINIYGVSIGAMQYNKHIVPSFGILLNDPPEEFNITSVYGFDFSNKSHVLGVAGFVGPLYLGAHYQTDKSFHFSLGGMRTWHLSKYDDDEYLGLHGALTYSTHNKFGLDIGLTLGINGIDMDEEELIASVGALVYKDNTIPTVGLGGSIGLGSLGIAGLIVGVIWGGYKLYTEVNSHL